MPVLWRIDSFIFFKEKVVLTQWGVIWVSCKAVVPANGWILMLRGKRSNLAAVKRCEVSPNVLQGTKEENVRVYIE